MASSVTPRAGCIVLIKLIGRFTTLIWLVAFVAWLAFSQSQWYPTPDPPHRTISATSQHAVLTELEKRSWLGLSHQDSFQTADDLNVFGKGHIAQEDAESEPKEYPDESDDDEILKQAHVSRHEVEYVNIRTFPGRANNCGSVEEMGRASVGNVTTASLQFRGLVSKYLAEHGASYVGRLSAREFCQRGFVYGRAIEDGVGNNIYKILTAAGLGMMLNRSLIIGEQGSMNPAYLGLSGQVHLPFGEYLMYSNETFSVREVKRLWAKHDCAGRFNRRLIMRIDDFEKPTRTKVLCEDWTKWKHPIIWFRGTTDSNALQFFVKNIHPAMRLSATLLLGYPSRPSSRPNVFGELFRALISPKPVVDEAIQWALEGGQEPDLSVHMRMLSSRSSGASQAACTCIRSLINSLLPNKTLPRIVIVSDTDFVIKHIKQQLEGFVKVVNFDYHLFVRSNKNLSMVMNENYFQPPEKRKRDWGSMPRWVALVDLFLASKAKYAVISGANRRVGTTFVQLIASLAAAMRMGPKDNINSEFGFFSSFQPSLLINGLAGQRGWGHTWRRFAGHLSCNNQTGQCAQTPLLPYAWWDGPWQSPHPRDLQIMRKYGVNVLETGFVEENSLEKICQQRKSPVDTLELKLPSCKKLNLCVQ